MANLVQTPLDQLVDSAGRPYFLWDCDMTLAEFERKLVEESVEGRAYLIGKLMRQARPDDVFLFVTVDEIVELWPSLLRYLGRERPFWEWLLRYWGCELRAA
ncbi:MAG: hypothetical protein KDC95_11565 [Planctomycetes bacterium]|nr:hypothetical protein [Planctomycetota bacterium]